MIIAENTEIEGFDGCNVNSFLLVRYVSESGENGFNCDDDGNLASVKICMNSVAVLGDEVVRLTEDNILRERGKVKFGEKRFLIHSPNEEFVEDIDQVSAYFRKYKMYETKLRMGKGANEPVIPDFLWLSRQPEDFKALEHSLTRCSFVSLWPGYWGELGSHFYLLSNADEDGVITSLKELAGIEVKKGVS